MEQTIGMNHPIIKEIKRHKKRPNIEMKSLNIRATI